MNQVALSSLNLKRSLDTVSETSYVFHLPALLQAPEGTLAERVASWRSRVGEVDKQLAENQREIDDIAFRFAEVQALLRDQGFVLFNTRGSHRTYHDASGRVLTIARPHGSRKTCDPDDIKTLLEVLGL